MLGPRLDIRWAHAVNSVAELQAAFAVGVDFIECDLGLLVDGVLFCAHIPTQVQSDLPFHVLLHRWSRSETPCGLKVDLKCPTLALSVLAAVQMSPCSYPVWINADVFGAKKKMHISDLVVFKGHVSAFSLGILGDGAFEEISGIIDEVTGFAHGHNFHITFAVNAGQAHREISGLLALLQAFPDSSATLWTSKGETIEAEMLASLISRLPANRVYADVTVLQLL